MTHSVCLIKTKRDRSFPFEAQRSFFDFHPLQSRAVFTAGDIFRPGRADLIIIKKTQTKSSQSEEPAEHKYVRRKMGNILLCTTGRGTAIFRANT